MGMLAYNNDPLVRQYVIDKIGKISKEDHWEQQPVSWNGKSGSIVGCLLEGTDLDHWETKFGLPKWLALLVDTLTVKAPDRLQAINEVISLLTRISTGEPLDTLGSRCIVASLMDKHLGLLHSAPNELPKELVTVLQDVVSLHKRLIDGDPPSNQEWRRARHAALTVTDTENGESLFVRIGNCVEAAAWNPVLSRTVVSDTFRTWINARVEIAQHSYPWTAEDDDKTKIILQELHDEAPAKAEDKEAFIDVFKLLEDKNPQWASRMKAYIKFDIKQFDIEWKQRAKLLNKIFENADEISHA